MRLRPAEAKLPSQILETNLEDWSGFRGRSRQRPGCEKEVLKMDGANESEFLPLGFQPGS